MWHNAGQHHKKNITELNYLIYTNTDNNVD